LKFSLSRKQFIIIILTIFLLGGILTGGYFWFIDPLKSDVTLRENELKNEEKILAVLEAKRSSEVTSSFETTVELQKKLPVKPLLDQLLLDLEKAEIISNSFIKTIQVENADASNHANTVDETQQIPNDENRDSQIEAESESSAGKSEETVGNEESNQFKQELPAGLKKITLTLSVQSPTYFEMEKFLQSLESMKRILTIENLSFKGNKELLSIDESIESLEYNVIIAAYYSPNLLELQDDLPTIKKPEPANKINPFVNSTSIQQYDSQTNKP
jgi:type IV pilus assembly protein PilO